MIHGVIFDRCDRYADTLTGMANMYSDVKAMYDRFADR